jgi:AraC-like DNA-binding protein
MYLPQLFASSEGIMSQLDAISGAISYIEAHVRSPIGVADMAEEASYSLYHFCRMFGKLTRHTPYEYLLRRRMTLAVADVIANDHNIVDIAFLYQFESHEGFTRAFGRMFGLCPSAARRQGYVPSVRYLPHLTREHLICLQEQNGLLPAFKELPEISSISQCFTRDHIGPDFMPGDDWVFIGVSNCTPEPPIIETGLYASFVLPSIPHNLALILDWILHVWLFISAYEMRLPGLLLCRASDSLVLHVPVCPAEHTR